jgi:hypothetical protein
MHQGKSTPLLQPRRTLIRTDIIFSCPSNAVFVPENYTIQPGAGPLRFSNTLDSINNADNTEPMSSVVATEYPDQTNFYAAAMAKFNGPELFFSEAAQSAPLGTAGVAQSDQETFSPVPNFGEVAVLYGDYNPTNESTLMDPSSASTVQAYPDASTSSADFTTPYVHYPIHAAALSVDGGLYDPDNVFGLRHVGTSSNTFQPSEYPGHDGDN